MSNPVLDRAAETVAQLRTQPQLAALREPEEYLVAQALKIAPEVDQVTLGAAWMILGNVLSALGGQHADALDLPTIVNLTQLAGQRLYSGTDLPRQVHCPHVYDTGARCKHTATAAAENVLDLMMAGHYATYHPQETWPPQEPPFEVVSDSAHPGWRSGLEELQQAPWQSAPLTVNLAEPWPQCDRCGEHDAVMASSKGEICLGCWTVLFPAAVPAGFVLCERCRNGVALGGPLCDACAGDEANESKRTFMLEREARRHAEAPDSIYAEDAPDVDASLGTCAACGIGIGLTIDDVTVAHSTPRGLAGGPTRPCPGSGRAPLKLPHAQVLTRLGDDAASSDG